MGYIYKIYNDINDLVYVGQTCRTIQERWDQHLHASQKLKNTNKLYTAMRELGSENFHIIQLEECENQLLNQKENYWITFFNSKQNGYNTVNAPNTKWTKRYSIFNNEIDQVEILTTFAKYKKSLQNKIFNNKEFFFQKPSQQEINKIKNKLVIYQWNFDHIFIMSYDSIEMAALLNNLSTLKLFKNIDTNKIYQNYYWTTTKYI